MYEVYTNNLQQPSHPHHYGDGSRMCLCNFAFANAFRPMLLSHTFLAADILSEDSNMPGLIHTSTSCKPHQAASLGSMSKLETREFELPHPGHKLNRMETRSCEKTTIPMGEEHFQVESLLPGSPRHRARFGIEGTGCARRAPQVPPVGVGKLIEKSILRNVLS